MSISKAKCEALITLVGDLKDSGANRTVITAAILSFSGDNALDFIPVLNSLVDSMDKPVKDNNTNIKELGITTEQPFFEQCFQRPEAQLVHELNVLKTRVLMIETALHVGKNAKRREKIALLLKLLNRVSVEQSTKRMRLDIPAAVTPAGVPVAHAVPVSEQDDPPTIVRSVSAEAAAHIWSLFSPP